MDMPATKGLTSFAVFMTHNSKCLIRSERSELSTTGSDNISLKSIKRVEGLVRWISP